MVRGRAGELPAHRAVRMRATRSPACDVASRGKREPRRWSAARQEGPWDHLRCPTHLRHDVEDGNSAVGSASTSSRGISRSGNFSRTRRPEPGPRQCGTRLNDPVVNRRLPNALDQIRRLLRRDTAARRLGSAPAVAGSPPLIMRRPREAGTAGTLFLGGPVCRSQRCGVRAGAARAPARHRGPYLPGP